MSSSLSAHQTPHLWATAIRGDADFGVDLEYDNAWLALVQASQGKPETQFEPAIAPDWVTVLNQAEHLLTQSRDLRLVALWAEARLRLHGLQTLSASMHIISDMMESGWDFIYPSLDFEDADPYARINVIEGLGRGGSFYQSVRESTAFELPSLGPVNIRGLEALLDAASYPDTQVAYSREQIQQYLGEQPEALETLHALVADAREALGRCGALLAECTGGHQASSLADLTALFNRLTQVLPALESPIGELPVQANEESAHARCSSSGSIQSSPVNPAFVSGAIQSRQQALHAIDAVCIYLDNAEPTNPAQLLLKRARRLIDKNFLELVKDLAPDALVEVARIMGVNPDDLQAGSQ